MITSQARFVSRIFIAGLLSFAFAATASADDWNQWQGQNRDGTWSESGILKSFPKEGLKLLWRKPVASGFSGPAVAGDRVFVTDYLKTAGDATFDPGKRSVLEGAERIHCLDRKTGETIWSKSYDCKYNISYALGPRANPTVDGDKVYTLGAEGHLNCYKVADGELVWQKDLKKEYKLKEAPMWGYAAHPLISGDMLYCMVGGEGSIAVAFNKNTGKEIWRSLSSKDAGYCPPTLIKAGGTEQLLIFHPTAIVSVDPKTGKEFWSHEIRPAYDMSIIAPIQHGDHLLVTALSGSTLLLKLDTDKPAATKVWDGMGTHPDNNPPVIFEGHIYGVDVKGRLRCIELVSGKRIWESFATCPGGRPASSTTGFVVRNNDQWFIANEEGDLILAKMSPAGYEEIGRAKMLEATSVSGGRNIVWSHPAFSQKCVFARNDKEIVCYSLKE